ncbi:hypothetical protein [Thermoanaerobacterium thermosaccharolyticum]|uniref:hypothetical protein n=1 Tax=Thermoanaerobacterium thermosaccharolyticum TaxID=1517 RepID=UPI0002FA6AB4|nr:hypothetical protein [Thermoanaerobacterium thermosaccharolyticum]MCP2239470.1 hypothetical protein [Thermoanaerobacterium thermosaccharolyticum]
MVLKELKDLKENYPIILLSENVYFGETFEELLKSINGVKDKDEKIRLLEAAFRVNMKKAVEVYKMYSDIVNEETQEYIIKT